VTRATSIWAAVAAADRFSVAEREAVASRIRTGGLAADPGAAIVETCHRVEVYALGEGGGFPDPALPPTPVVLDGDDVVRHLCRLACGLESAILGEDQVLHQVRDALAALRDRHADPRLIRLFELAVGAGRRARADRPSAQRNLGELAVRWLVRREAIAPGAPVLVVGTGPMGRLAAAAFIRRGATVTIASRTQDRAAEAAIAVAAAGGVDLDQAARSAAGFTAIVLAIRGVWSPAVSAGMPSGVVDLSVPGALPVATRRGLGDRFADVDVIFREAASLAAEGDTAPDFRAAADAIVEEAVAAYRSWSAGRPSVETLRALRDRSEEHRAAELQRLLRRLPDLEPRERELVAAFSERLVAGLLHAPSAALRDDVDGSAAAAAQRLFGL
jgi:glutamyl-tRNA reductase